MSYAKSNINEIGSVTAVHYLIQSTTFVSSNDFQTLNLGSHFQDLNEEEGYRTVRKKDDSYVSLNVTQNGTLLPTEIENETFMITKKIILSQGIFKRA